MGSGTPGGADVLGGDEISRSYEQYIEKVACDDLAREVKLADLADNLANNRRLASTPDVAARIDRYEQAVRRLQSPLRRTPQRARPDGALG